MPRKPAPEKPARLDEIESGVVDLFSNLVRMLGFPPSIGAIYGLLFISENPLCLDDLVDRLGISKGSASQGLAVLRKVGALRPATAPGRREYYSADLELKRLVGGFLRTEVMPQLDAGTLSLESLKSAAEATAPDRREFLRDRLGKLNKWQNRGRQVLGLLHRFLD